MDSQLLAEEGAKYAALLKDPAYCAKRIHYANQLFVGGPKLFPDIREGLIQMLADYNDDCDGFVFHILGRLYRLADREEESMEHHTEGYKRLQFTLDDPQCQHAMGWLCETGKPVTPGFKKNAQEALKWYTKSAEQGYVTAIYAIGSLHKSGHLGKADYDLAMEWFLRAGNMGYPNAQHSVGLMYKQGGGSIKIDYQTSLEWYHKAAAQGYGSAEYSIGILYNQGFGVEQDFTKAKEWFTRAADQGYANAQHSIGLLYRNGKGVEKDLDMAREWFVKAADQGYENAIESMKLLPDPGPGG